MFFLTERIFNSYGWYIASDFALKRVVGKSFRHWGGGKKAGLPQGQHAVEQFVNQMRC